MYIPITRVDDRAFGRGQQKVLDEFFVHIGGFEARIVPFHTDLTVMAGIDFREWMEPALWASNVGGRRETMGDFTAEVPALRGKTEIFEASERG
jgi:hypothetical protein